MRDHPALDPRADGVLLVDQRPGVVRPLLVAEGDALGLGVELEDHHLDLVAHREVLGRVVDPAPRDVGDVQQAVDAAEVDEHAVVGDVLDDAAEAGALFKPLEGLGLLLGELGLEHRLAGEDDVVAPAVQADDLELQLLAAQRLQVLDRLDVDQGPGQEGAQTDVHRQTALDAVGDTSLDDPAVLVGALHLGPAAHALGLGVGEEDVALLVLGLLEQDIDFLADVDGELPATVGELLDGDQAFRLVPHVDDHRVGRDADDAPRHDLTLGEIAHALVVQFEELAVFVRVLLLIGLSRHQRLVLEFFTGRHRKTYLLGLGFRLSGLCPHGRGGDEFRLSN